MLIAVALKRNFNTTTWGRGHILGLQCMSWCFLFQELFHRPLSPTVYQQHCGSLKSSSRNPLLRIAKCIWSMRRVCVHTSGSRCKFLEPDWKSLLIILNGIKFTNIPILFLTWTMSLTNIGSRICSENYHIEIKMKAGT